MQVKVAQVEKIETMLPAMLVSATYDGMSKSAVLKFMNQQSKNYFYGKMKLDTNHIVIQNYLQMN